MSDKDEQQQDAEFPDEAELAIEESTDETPALPAPEQAQRKGSDALAGKSFLDHKIAGPRVRTFFKSPRFAHGFTLFQHRYGAAHHDPILSVIQWRPVDHLKQFAIVDQIGDATDPRALIARH